MLNLCELTARRRLTRAVRVAVLISIARSQTWADHSQPKDCRLRSRSPACLTPLVAAAWSKTRA